MILGLSTLKGAPHKQKTNIGTRWHDWTERFMEEKYVFYSNKKKIINLIIFYTTLSIII